MCCLWACHWDEKVVDQWQVAYRGELSGSTAGQSIFNVGSAGTNLSSSNPDAWLNAFSNDWTQDSLNGPTYASLKIHEIFF